jgi:hypothetical protein
MARKSPLARRGRVGVLAMLTTSAAGALLFTAILSTELAGATGSGVAGEDRVIVCESGVVDLGGGVETSSAVAFRATDGAGAPLGCRDG